MSAPRPKLHPDDFIADLLEMRKEIEWLKKRVHQPDVGSITLFAYGTSAPDGYLLCDGTVYNISDFPDLGGLLLGTWGGNGTTTFGVPDVATASRYLLMSSVGIGVGGSLGHNHGLTNAQANIMLGTSTAVVETTSVLGGIASPNFKDTIAHAAATSADATTNATRLQGNTDSAFYLPLYVQFLTCIKF